MNARITLDVTADSEAVMEKHFAQWLRTRGWHVAAPNADWESKGEFCERVGIDHDKFHRKLDEWSQRGHVIPLTRKQPSLRVCSVCSNPDFDQFCQSA
jgi:hypothetical protein